MSNRQEELLRRGKQTQQLTQIISNTAPQTGKRSLAKETIKYMELCPPGTSEDHVSDLIKKYKGDSETLQNAINELWEDYRGSGDNDWAPVERKKNRKKTQGPNPARDGSGRGRSQGLGRGGAIRGGGRGRGKSAPPGDARGAPKGLAARSSSTARGPERPQSSKKGPAPVTEQPAVGGAWAQTVKSGVRKPETGKRPESTAQKENDPHNKNALPPNPANDSVQQEKRLPSTTASSTTTTAPKQPVKEEKQIAVEGPVVKGAWAQGSAAVKSALPPKPKVATPSPAVADAAGESLPRGPRVDESKEKQKEEAVVNKEQHEQQKQQQQQQKVQQSETDKKDAILPPAQGQSAWAVKTSIPSESNSTAEPSTVSSSLSPPAVSDSVLKVDQSRAGRWGVGISDASKGSQEQIPQTKQQSWSNVARTTQEDGKASLSPATGGTTPSVSGSDNKQGGTTQSKPAPPGLVVEMPKQAVGAEAMLARSGSGASSPKEFLKMGKWDSLGSGDIPLLQFGSFTLDDVSGLGGSSAWSAAAVRTGAGSGWGAPATSASKAPTVASGAASAPSSSAVSSATPAARAQSTKTASPTTTTAASMPAQASSSSLKQEVPLAKSKEESAPAVAPSVLRPIGAGPSSSSVSAPRGGSASGADAGVPASASSSGSRFVPRSTYDTNKRVGGMAVGKALSGESLVAGTIGKAESAPSASATGSQAGNMSASSHPLSPPGLAPLSRSAGSGTHTGNVVADKLPKMKHVHELEAEARSKVDRQSSAAASAAANTAGSTGANNAAQASGSQAAVNNGSSSNNNHSSSHGGHGRDASGPRGGHGQSSGMSGGGRHHGKYRGGRNNSSNNNLHSGEGHQYHHHRSGLGGMGGGNSSNNNGSGNNNLGLGGGVGSSGSLGLGSGGYSMYHLGGNSLHAPMDVTYQQYQQYGSGLGDHLRGGQGLYGFYDHAQPQQQQQGFQQRQQADHQHSSSNKMARGGAGGSSSSSSSSSSASSSPAMGGGRAGSGASGMSNNNSGSSMSSSSSASSSSSSSSASSSGVSGGSHSGSAAGNSLHHGYQYAPPPPPGMQVPYNPYSYGNYYQGNYGYYQTGGHHPQAAAGYHGFNPRGGMYQNPPRGGGMPYGVGVGLDPAFGNPSAFAGAYSDPLAAGPQQYGGMPGAFGSGGGLGYLQPHAPQQQQQMGGMVSSTSSSSSSSPASSTAAGGLGKTDAQQEQYGHHSEHNQPHGGAGSGSSSAWSSYGVSSSGGWSQGHASQFSNVSGASRHGGRFGSHDGKTGIATAGGDM